MSTHTHRIARLLATIALAVVAAVLPLRLDGAGAKKKSAKKEPYPVRTYKAKITRTDKGYKSLFHDVQSVQLPAARKYGIKPIEHSKSIAPLVKKGKLVKVANKKLVQMAATYPYLRPHARDILYQLARNYQARVGTGHRLRVTSCLRTRSFIKNELKGNINSTQNSCHLYGTTFDISYARMTAKEKEALARCLKEFQNAGYIYVIYEVKQPCFHVTVRR